MTSGPPSSTMTTDPTTKRPERRRDTRVVTMAPSRPADPNQYLVRAVSAAVWAQTERGPVPFAAGLGASGLTKMALHRMVTTVVSCNSPTTWSAPVRNTGSGENVARVSPGRAIWLESGSLPPARPASAPFTHGPICLDPSGTPSLRENAIGITPSVKAPS
jgi:hypothetical protein